MLVLETTCDDELEEVLAAIKAVHLRYCTPCARGAVEHIALQDVDQ